MMATNGALVAVTPQRGREPHTSGSPRALLLATFHERQAERDAHAERHHGRTVPARPCMVLFLLEEQLRQMWCDIAELDGLTLTELYGLEACRRDCPDCAPAVAP